MKTIERVYPLHRVCNHITGMKRNRKTHYKYIKYGTRKENSLNIYKYLHFILLCLVWFWYDLTWKLHSNSGQTIQHNSSGSCRRTNVEFCSVCFHFIRLNLFNSKGTQQQNVPEYIINVTHIALDQIQLSPISMILPMKKRDEIGNRIYVHKIVKRRKIPTKKNNWSDFGSLLCG